jgi:hypothetical protein
MFVYVVLFRFSDIFVSLVVFSSTVGIFPVAPIFYLFYLFPPIPRVSCPLPLCLYGPDIQSFFSFSSLAVSNYLFSCSDLPARALPYHFISRNLFPVLFLFGVLLGSLPPAIVTGSGGAALIERRFSLLILFIIFFAIFK